MQRHETKTLQYPSTLYKVVFESTQVKMSILLLFAFLLLQPVSLAFASETPEEISGEPAESIVIEQSVLEEDVQEEVEEVQTVEEVIEDTEAPSEEVFETESQEDDSEAVEQESPVESIDIVEVSTSTVDEVSTSTENEIVDDAIASSTDESGGSEEVIDEGNTEVPSEEVGTEEDTEVPVQEADIEEDTDEELQEENTATSTDEQATTTDESVLVVDHNSSAYEFDTKDCASVGDGAFYCSSTEDSEEFVQDGVFAAPDADGDLEIFVRLNGEESIITSNNVDDSAPYYDALSQRIVWHANYNDRYQIVSYDLETGEETRLTSAAYNNMEPVAYGDITLWQAWINNNWEIIMSDGNEQVQLTHNDMHDVSPHMRSGYIVWQTQFAEGWQVAVYDQEAQRIEYVEAEGGAKIENPRFVLVYDSTNDAGDVQTVGYDFDNKQSFTLNSIPAQLPDELPEPDQTGETRALIQNKHSVKGSEIEELEPVPTGNSTSTSATSTDTNGVPTLDLTSSSSSTASSTETVIPDATELIVTAYQPAIENEEISHIPDILIPPLEATSTAEVR